MKDDVQIYTSTMLTFSGIDGLVPCDEDEERVKRVLIKDLKFKKKHIERVHIREGRFWCIVYVRAPLNVIKDRQKALEKRTRRERREQVRPQNYYQLTPQQRAERGIPPLYSIREFNRRPSESKIDEELQSGAENARLYILNFDICTTRCHKGVCPRGDMWCGLVWFGVMEGDRSGFVLVNML